jgi:hypothetical protein
MAKDNPQPDDKAVALAANATQIALLRRDDPTERSTELVEWLSSEFWARLVQLARGAEWGTVVATLEVLDIETARTAMEWAVVELARLQS